MKTFILAIFLLFSSLSFADYIKGGLGVSISGDTTFKGSGLESEEEHKAMMLSKFVAYGFNIYEFLAIEGELSLRASNYKTSAISNSVASNNFAINVVGTLPEHMSIYNLNVYAGLGAAYGQYSLGAGSEKEFGSGAQGFIGIDYSFESKIKLGAEYRYFQAFPEVDLGNSAEADYVDTSVFFTAKFPF